MAMKGMMSDAGSVKMHFEEHIEYPATKAEIVKACSEMSDVEEADKEWVVKNLPDKTYKNANAVMKALKMK